jgi:hypothetical protein
MIMLPLTIWFVQRQIKRKSGIRGTGNWKREKK